MKRLLVVLIFLLNSELTYCQNELVIAKIDSEVNIDGVLNEEFWATLQKTSPFVNQWPKDTGLADLQTEVSMAYDDDNIYVGITCYDISNEHIIQTLKRDKDDEHFGSDGIAIVIDPFNQKANGFFFGINAGGAQFEGLIYVDGAESFINENWDNKWISDISYGEKVWYVEMAIPFRTLRYNPNGTKWGLNFVRNDMKHNSYSSWNPVPRNLNTINLGYTGQLIWPKQLPEANNDNINIIPYAAGGVYKDYANAQNVDFNFDAGIDAKLAMTPSLNLDLTLNPDFSNVDVDQQTTNLTRFPLFFPEKRSFFLENSDLFTSFGIRDITPFFSRKIGLDNGEPIPIRFGARITGNLNQKLRVGLMDIQTASAEGVNSQNYLVGSFSHRIGKRSSFDFMFVNRQRTSGSEDPEEYYYNRVMALEYTYLDDAGKWGGNIGYHKSFNPGSLQDESYYTATLRYNDENINIRLSGHRVGENYLTDVGFVPRLNNYDAINQKYVRIGFYQLAFNFNYNFFPKNENSKLNLHGPRSATTVILYPDGTLNSFYSGMFYLFDFKNQNVLELSYINERNDVPFDTYVVGSIPFTRGYYSYDTFHIWYRFDPRRKLAGSFGLDYGGFYNGNRFSLVADISLRLQPWGNFGLKYEFNDISLPEYLESSQLHLVGVKSEIAFSNKMFWTTFLQYNTQLENFNINSRFQWRYRTMSDLFVVYADNYFPESLRVINRGIVVKLTYAF